MKGSFKKGFLKVTECAFVLGFLGGSIAGLSILGVNYKKAQNSYERMMNNETVVSYIQENLGEINQKYDDGILNYNEYRKEVDSLKEDAAHNVYGEEYDKVVKDMNFNKYLIFIPSLTTIISSAAAIGEAIAREKSVLGVASDKSDEKKDKKRYEKIIDKLNEDSWVNVESLTNINKYKDNVIFQVNDKKDDGSHYIVYKADTSKLDFPKYKPFENYYPHYYAYYNPELHKQIWKIVKNKPIFVGREKEMIKKFNIKKHEKEESEKS